MRKTKKLVCRLVCACVLSLPTKSGYLASRPNYDYRTCIPEIFFEKVDLQSTKMPNYQNVPCGEYFSEPTVCFNAVRPRGGVYGFFICPEEGQGDNMVYCCGEEGDQRCCGFWEE